MKHFKGPHETNTPQTQSLLKHSSDLKKKKLQTKESL